MAGIRLQQGYQYDDRTGQYHPISATQGALNAGKSTVVAPGSGARQEAGIRNWQLQEQRNREAAASTGTVYTPTAYGGQGSMLAGSSGGRGVPGAYGSGGAGGGGGVGGGLFGPYGSPGPSGEIVTSPGVGGGDINLSRPGYESQELLRLKAKLANEAMERILAQTGGAQMSKVEYGGGGQADAARAASFARAKEQAGMNANAALQSLQDVMGKRGLRGSSIEAGATGDIIQGGGTDIANVITKQMEDELGNVRHVADTQYQGGIQQRGQDIQARQALFSILAGLY